MIYDWFVSDGTMIISNLNNVWKIKQLLIYVNDNFYDSLILIFVFIIGTSDNKDVDAKTHATTGFQRLSTYKETSNKGDASIVATLPNLVTMDNVGDDPDISGDLDIDQATDTHLGLNSALPFDIYATISKDSTFDYINELVTDSINPGDVESSEVENQDITTPFMWKRLSTEANTNAYQDDSTELAVNKMDLENTTTVSNMDTTYESDSKDPLGHTWSKWTTFSYSYVYTSQSDTTSESVNTKRIADKFTNDDTFTTEPVTSVEEYQTLGLESSKNPNGTWFETTSPEPSTAALTSLSEYSTSSNGIYNQDTTSSQTYTESFTFTDATTSLDEPNPRALANKNKKNSSEGIATFWLLLILVPCSVIILCVIRICLKAYGKSILCCCAKKPKTVQVQPLFSNRGKEKKPQQKLPRSFIYIDPMVLKHYYKATYEDILKGNVKGYNTNPVVLDNGYKVTYDDITKQTVNRKMVESERQKYNYKSNVKNTKSVTPNLKLLRLANISDHRFTASTKSASKISIHFTNSRVHSWIENESNRNSKSTLNPNNTISSTHKHLSHGLDLKSVISQNKRKRTRSVRTESESLAVSPNHINSRSVSVFDSLTRMSTNSTRWSAQPEKQRHSTKTPTKSIDKPIEPIDNESVKDTGTRSSSAKSTTQLLPSDTSTRSRANMRHIKKGKIKRSYVSG